jgi:hypothetical protein
MIGKRNLLLALPLLASSMPLAAQDVPKILSDPEVAGENYLPDFSYAGYGFGVEEIPEFERTVSPADYGAIPDDGKDDSKGLIAAIAAAAKMDGKVRIQLAAGRYILSEILWIERGDILIAGMGAGKGGTQIYMPRPLDQMDDGGASDELRKYLAENDKYERQPVNNLNVLFSEYSWNGGLIWVRYPGGRHATYIDSYDRPIETVAQIGGGKRGSRMLQVPQRGALKIGDVVQIHWHNRAGQDGPLIKSLYGDTKEKIGSRHWELPARPLVRQATRIEAIDGDQVTIGDPLLHDIGAALPAYFAKWDHLQDVGLEDFALVFPENPYFGHHNESGFNAVYFTGVHNGWIRNVTISNSDSGILTDDVANVTIANIRTDGDHKAHYSVHVGNVHNVLIDGLTVLNPTEHTFSFNTQATKSVYTNSVGWVQPTLDQHAGANHQNLYDNVMVHITPDQIRADGLPMYDLYKAGGAGYWVPGHGRFNTAWNTKVLVEGGAAPDQQVVILGASEGPDARNIGLHGNRMLVLDHTPAPYAESLNSRVDIVPSLYAHQRAQRMRDAAK